MLIASNQLKERMSGKTNKNVKETSLKRIKIGEEIYYKILNHDAMRPFFMSIVSDSNHWMFISSNGGLTAGRKDAENAFFPYYTDDKITESYDTTGSKSIFRVKKGGEEHLWEPFSPRNEGRYRQTRNLFKNKFGNKIIFEEINHDLELSFRYKWSSSNRFGFIREAQLHNLSEVSIEVNMLDGIQNIMPFGVSSDLQGIRSNLVDAYKRNELVQDAGLGIYALSAIIVDRAEPSEALKGNIAWSLGVENAKYLVSSVQLDTFRNGGEISEETDVKAERGAYFVNQTITIASEKRKKWMIIANVNQDTSSVLEMAHLIKNDIGNLKKEIEEDIELGTERLVQRVAASDGIQYTADKKRNTRHFSNTLFNIMRGGIFDHNYDIEKWDFSNYLRKANTACFKTNSAFLIKLSDTFTLQELRIAIAESGDLDMLRLSLEYLPLKFSRRHGDPSRPWNKFSINTRSEVDGSKILDYEGNWRDIFQNWEALAHSYPAFIESMILKFLNASTFDGYNPYRVTKDGFDWETIEPHDPWSYIGYWGDHQIIYLLKFLEFIQDYYPEKLVGYFTKDLFVYANVPYRIKTYDKILSNPKDTIEFDDDLDRNIRSKVKDQGADGALLATHEGIYHVNFIEKMLVTSLAKISNFIPEAGIWLNTQRPEWNDANNALVGNGVSMVTLYYLRRFMAFFDEILAEQDETSVSLSREVQVLFQSIYSTLNDHLALLNDRISDQDRRSVMDGLGKAGSNYRESIYAKGFSGEKASQELGEISDFIKVVLSYLDHAIEANRRSDGMYHAYNLMTVEDNGAVSISYLDEMLEGQVAVLSSGYLDAKDSIGLLDAMKGSKLFRPDQFSYLLYPNKELPGFLEKNNIPSDRIQDSMLLSRLIDNGNRKIIVQDIHGNFHFNGDFKNANDLKQALHLLDEAYNDLVAKETSLVLQIFEEVFNHKAFTGRSGTFFGYEGLGSIYWHMVSKLLLAVEESSLRAIENNESTETVGRLLEHFYEINEGIGVHKSPKLYGAFPIDPYSHTPLTKGAQQPGMTGQVKEDILSRKGELGVFVHNGQIHFDPRLLRKNEFIKEAKSLEFINVSQKKEVIELPEGTLAFTYCQVMIIYKIADENSLVVAFHDAPSRSIDSHELDRDLSQEIFNRTEVVKSITVLIKPELLK